MTINVSVLLCTVRNNAYDGIPKDAVIDVIDQLAVQTFKSFELVVVDGIFHRRKAAVEAIASRVGFQIVHVPPTSLSPWVRLKKVAICAYRNTGIAHCRGELIVNLDDCCELPPNYVEMFWRSWHEYRTALAMCWPKRNDHRRSGRVLLPGQVFGFGSYPRELALALNGYDEAYDGAQGLEDGDWSYRLFKEDLQQALLELPGFDVHPYPQSKHDPEAVDPNKPLCKCCNQAWNTERVFRDVRRANTAELWYQDTLKRLVGPCFLLSSGGLCAHHNYRNKCAYIDTFAKVLDPDAALIFKEPPIFDLAAISKIVRP